MRLDLLIATHKRPGLLRAALTSVARAARPQAMEVSVTIVNNDKEPLVLEPELLAPPYPVRVLQERRRGKSAALNAGVAVSTADYIGLIDDDEEIAGDWFQVVEQALETGKFDFIGGRAVLRPLERNPAWLPPGYPAVLGTADGGPEPLSYGFGFPGVLMGGNAVISRAALLSAGPYNTALGPCEDRRLFSCEDEDMYWRLIEAGARGRYLPELVVYHCVHPERLSKSYYRAWCFWNGASKGVMSRWRPPQVPQIVGVPRYMYGEAFLGLLAWLRAVLNGGPAAQRTAAELPAWHLAGRLYGRHFQKDKRRGTGIERRAHQAPKSRRYIDGTPII